MPAKRVWYQQVFTVALTWLSIIIIINSVVPPNSHTSPDKRGELSRLAALTGKQIRLTWIWDRRPALGPPLYTGMVSAGETPRVSSISIEISWSICLSWQATRHGLLRALTECNHVSFFFILFLLSFFLIVCILCIIAFGASSFYSFLYHKCTTLYHILNYWNGVCFRRVSFVWWGKKKVVRVLKDTHCALFFIWIVFTGCWNGM